MLLLYYRTYATQIFIGFLFGIDDSRYPKVRAYFSKSNGHLKNASPFSRRG
ncbi:MAG: hypothetical protein K2P93_03380 [Alphaproteobacteria bacterium]|nr:hypothetical protein [Alphaproteobacteria bacterium]